MKAIVPVVDPETSNQVHCGPGPFSMAGPDMVSTMLRGVGFDRVTFERHDCDICIGRDLAEAIEFAMALGPAGEVMRLAGAEAERLKPEVVAALHQRADAVRARRRRLRAVEHVVHHGDESRMTGVVQARW